MKTRKAIVLFSIAILILLVGLMSFDVLARESQQSLADSTVTKTIVLDGKKSFEEQVRMSNTVYIIRHVFDLQYKDISIPENCVLRFDGGCLRNFASITFNRTYIDAAPYRIFYFDEMRNKGDLKKCNGDFSSALLASSHGGLLNDKMPIEWFGANANSNICSAEAPLEKFGDDCSSALQFAINTSHIHRNSVYLTPSRHHYHIANTIYLPSSFSIVGENYAYALNSFGDTNSYASELFFSCKYLFRAKKNKGQSEQERLRNNIKANIEGISIHGIYTSAPRPVTARNTSTKNDICSYKGDYYWEKKTYVFFGCILNESKLTNLKVWGVGTFIYGAVRGLTKLTDNTIRYSRNLICGAAGSFDNRRKWNTNHDFPLPDGTKEIEFGSNTSYTLNEVNYIGYEEPVECYTSPSGAVSSYDVTIENNYLTCPSTRCITFYEVSPEQVTIQNNYIDFAFSVFALRTQSELRILHNTFDYCYMVLLCRAMDKITFVTNTVTRSTRRDICEGSKINIAWWDNDYTEKKAYSQSGTNDGHGFSSISHHPAAIVLYGDFNNGYIRNTIINDNAFVGVSKFFFSQSDEFRRSSDISITGNTFDKDCDSSFSLKFTNGDKKGDEDAYEGEATNIFVQQWAKISISNYKEISKYSQTPSHSSGTWLAQNINSVFIDSNGNNSYYLVGDTYVPVNNIKAITPLYSETSVLKGKLVPGSTGLVYDEYSRRFGLVVDATNEPGGQVAVDGDGFKIMKKRYEGWVKTTEEGYQQYNTNLHRWGYYYNGSFLDFQGYHITLRSGSSVMRPTNALTSTDIGYEYYDTDLNAPVYFTIVNGVKKWTTAEGIDVTNVTALKGTTKQRTSMWLSSDNEGLKYYDTSLKKWVLFNGTKWTNLDGTQL